MFQPMLCFTYRSAVSLLFLDIDFRDRMKFPKYSFSNLKTTLSSTRFSFSRSSSATLAAEDEDKDEIAMSAQLVRVFIYLPVSDLLVCGLVSKAWRKCSHAAQIWQRLIISQDILIGPQWNYLLEKHEKSVGYAWKMVYFQYQRQNRHWKEIIYSRKIMQFSNNQQIKW